MSLISKTVSLETLKSNHFRNVKSVALRSKRLSKSLSSFFFYFIFKLYIIVLVLPNIKMNPPQVYMRSPS